MDFLTTTYNRSYIQTYNLGYGGATIDPSLVASPFGDIVQSFRQQLHEEFLPTYTNNPTVPWAPADTLFTIFFGINDVIISYGQRNSSLNFALIKSYEALIHEVRGHLRSFEPIDHPNRLTSFTMRALAISSSWMFPRSTGPLALPIWARLTERIRRPILGCSTFIWKILRAILPPISQIRRCFNSTPIGFLPWRSIIPILLRKLPHSKIAQASVKLTSGKRTSDPWLILIILNRCIAAHQHSIYLIRPVNTEWTSISGWMIFIPHTRCTTLLHHK